MNLPRTVLDRIHRYAAEGREPKAVYRAGDYRLLAVATGQVPVVIVRAANQDQFDDVRGEVLEEWQRTLLEPDRRRRSA